MFSSCLLTDVAASVGQVLKRYRSGKLPKALKILPSLVNWEDALVFTRPDEWSNIAHFAACRIFAAGLNDKMAQRLDAFSWMTSRDVHTQVLQSDSSGACAR